MALDLDGTHVFVANIYSNNVSVIDISSNTVVATIPVENSPIAFGKFITKVPVPQIFPINKDECKKDKWATFVNVNTGQQLFKNQGDCIQYVNTGK